jgi:hypothetical protein
MRFDLPQEVPHEVRRKRELESPSAPAVEPSPLDLHRESLAEQAANPRELNLPKPKPRERPHLEPDRSPALDNPSGPPSPVFHDVLRLEIDRPQQEQEHPVSPSRSLERRPPRQSLPLQTIGLALRTEEQKVLLEVGRFRVVATRDLAETVYADRPRCMERDLAYLRQRGLVSVDSVNARRDGRGGRIQHIEVVTLTKHGRDLAQRIAGLPADQKLYAGLVKPREVEHDAQIYRAYRKEAEKIEQAGGTNLRVCLDFELKAQVQKAIYAERKADPRRDMDEIKQQVAARFDLPFVNDGIQIPDARIDYDLVPKGDQELDQGSRSGHADIEVLTAAYRPGHIQGKVQAGFHLYASSSDRATLTARVEGDHHLLDNILEL